MGIWITFFAWLALTCNPPDLHLPGSWDYRCEPLPCNSSGNLTPIPLTALSLFNSEWLHPGALGVGGAIHFLINTTALMFSNLEESSIHQSGSEIAMCAIFLKNKNLCVCFCWVLSVFYLLLKLKNPSFILSWLASVWSVWFFKQLQFSFN
jgi:hypothetical protein